MTMRVIHANKAQDIFESLVKYVDEYYDPILIAGDRCNAVLISEKYWSGIQETLYLMASPGMFKAIKKARKQSIMKSKKTITF